MNHRRPGLLVALIIAMSAASINAADAPAAPAGDAALVAKVNGLVPGNTKAIDTAKLTKDLVALGEPVVPLMTQVATSDGIEGEIKGITPALAMNVLVELKAVSSVPALKEAARTGRRGWQRDALGTVVRLQNTPENRQFVIDTINGWLRNANRDETPASLCGLVFVQNLPQAGLPREQIVAIATACEIEQSTVRDQVLASLAGAPSEVSVHLLRHYAGKGPEVRGRIVELLSEAALQREEDVKAYSNPNFMSGVAHSYPPEEAEKVRRGWLAAAESDLQQVRQLQQELRPAEQPK